MLNRIATVLLVTILYRTISPGSNTNSSSSHAPDLPGLAREACEAYEANLEGLSDEDRTICKQMWNTICANVVADLERCSTNLRKAWKDLDSFIEHLAKTNPDLSEKLENMMMNVQTLSAYSCHLSAKMNLANAELNLETARYFSRQHAEQVGLLQAENDALREKQERLRKQFLRSRTFPRTRRPRTFTG